MLIDKTLLRATVLRQLQAELDLLTRAAQLARDEATNEESKAEGKYDTRAQEAAYLAEGQARQARELQETIALYQSLPLPGFAAGSRIALGALIRVGEGTTTSIYFLGPRAGGLEVEVNGSSILVVTPASPLGRQLLGKQTGDSITLPSRGQPAVQAITAIA